jgi:putative transposase
MHAMGLKGVHRGKVKRTTIAGQAVLPGDLVNRDFQPTAPNHLWVADFTYVSTWSGWVYVAFIIDAYARRILGWDCATAMTSDFVVHTLDQAIWQRTRDGHGIEISDTISHNDHGSQYTSLIYGEHMAGAGLVPSTGTVGDSYDNALAETINGLYKTELVKRHGPWKSINDLELATAEWVNWYNHQRLYEYCGDIPPAQAEQNYYTTHQTPQPVDA